MIALSEVSEQNFHQAGHVYHMAKLDSLPVCFAWAHRNNTNTSNASFQHFQYFF